MIMTKTVIKTTSNSTEKMPSPAASVKNSFVNLKSVEPDSIFNCVIFVVRILLIYFDYC